MNVLQEASMDDPRSVAATYYRSWKARDFESFRSILADDVTFRGPLGSADGAEECLEGIKGMSKIVTDIDVLQVFVAGDDVLTWFDLHTTVAPPCPTANWSHVEHGKLTRIRVTFDPRALVKG
ncbi:MAG: nuclear transport factor 2 family protein [Gaiellales bacterium]